MLGYSVILGRFMCARARGAWVGLAGALIMAGLSGCEAYDADFDDKEKPRAVHVNTVIEQVCETRDTVSFILKEYEITLPCDASKQFAASPPRDHNIDYSQLDYIEGVQPLPVRLLHFRLMDPEVYHPLWGNPPPTGVIINLHVPMHTQPPQNRKPSQRCYPLGAKVWCNHIIFISDTVLVAQLEFSAGATPSVSNQKNTYEKYPWASYPEETWPHLYERTEFFVKSIIK